MASRGYILVETDPIDFTEMSSLGIVVYHLIFGETIRGTSHAVVGKNGVMVHDPHPSKAGLILTHSKQSITFGILVRTFRGRK